MHAFRPAIVFLTVWIVFPLFLAASGIVVCPKCGHENKPEAAACSHCSAGLPAVKKKAETVSGPRETRYLSAAAVESEIALAGEYFGKEDYDLADLFLKNAAALDMLTDPRSTGGHSGRIPELRKKCQTGGMSVRGSCSDCGGTGKGSMQVTSLSGETTTMDVAGKSCAKCGGTGFVLRPSTMDERRYKLGRAASRFTAIQQSRKMVPVGGTWVPADIEKDLSPRQVASIKRVTAVSCATCAGLGRVDCKRCKGLGNGKCTVSQCVKGMVEVDTEGQLVKGKGKKTVKCKICGGAGRLTCADCSGKGSRVCEKCNGSGERALCVKCSGQGLLTCKRCAGTGSAKEALCGDCRGAGVVECGACNGDGRKK